MLILIYSEDCLKFRYEVGSSALDSLMDLLSSFTPTTRCVYSMCLFLKLYNSIFGGTLKQNIALQGMQKMQKQQQHFTGINVAYNIIHKWNACRMRPEKAVKWVNSTEIQENEYRCLRHYGCLSTLLKITATKQVSQA